MSGKRHVQQDVFNLSGGHRAKSAFIADISLGEDYLPWGRGPHPTHALEHLIGGSVNV